MMWDHWLWLHVTTITLACCNKKINKNDCNFDKLNNEPDSSDRQLGIISRFTSELEKLKPQTTNLPRRPQTEAAAFLHHFTLRYVNVLTGRRSPVLLPSTLRLIAL